MKTRMRRFWISVSLTAGSLALPLSGVLRAHDLPTSWTSGANSTGSWNYLMDDCLDLPVLPGGRSTKEVDLTGRRGTEDWASSCPAEWAADLGRPTRSADLDYEVLLRNPISRFSKEMTCWVNEWQMIQHSTKLIEPAPLWARLPENGNPPAPDYSLEYVGKYEPVQLADTCAFDAEYQARETVGELLAREIARAETISKYEARAAQAVVDAQRIQEIIDLDAIPSSMSFSSLASRVQAKGPMLCGGESREIMTAECFPKQYSSWKSHLPYVPSVTDEYLSYDLEARDQHWLGGLNRSWKLRSKLGAWPVVTDALRAEALVAKAAANSEVNADANVDANADKNVSFDYSSDSIDSPESFIAPDHVALHDPSGWDEFASEWDGTPVLAESAWGYDADRNEAEIQAYFNGVAIEAQRNAMGLIGTADTNVYAEPMLPQAEVLPELLPDLGLIFAATSAWIEDQQCAITGELCSLDRVYRAGQWLGDNSVYASQLIVDRTLAIGHYLDLPASAKTGLDVYVIYVDAEGNSLAVPSSLARAWNRPEVETEADIAEADPVDSADDAAMETTYDAAIEPTMESENVATADWVLLDQVGTQVLSTLANRLSSIGTQILQASDLLNSWAETQIASRESASVK